MLSLAGALFLCTILGYAAASGAYVAGLARRDARLLRVAWFLLLLALAAHSAVLVLHVAQIHRLPLGPPGGGAALGAWDHAFSSAAWLLAAALSGSGVGWPRTRVIGAFLTPVMLALTLGALLTGERHEMAAFLPDLLASAWFPIHALASYGSLALFALAFGGGIVYLLQDARLKRRELPTAGGLPLPSLETLDAVNLRSVVGGLVLLSLGIVTGTFWAVQAGPVDGIDLRPKVVMTLGLWMLYLLAWQARSVLGWRGRRSAWAAILGFLLLLLSFVGVAHT